MNKKMMSILEYNKILDRLAEFAISNRAKTNIQNMLPYSKIVEAERHRNDTTEAKRLLEALGTPPLASMDELDKVIPLLGKEAMLLPDQLTGVALFLNTCKRMKQYLKRGESMSSIISSSGVSLDPLQDLEDEITRCIRGDMVDDRATPELKNIRRQIEGAGDRIKQKLNSMLRSHPEWFMENYVIERNGHFALPVKKEYRRMVEGAVIDSSNSGGTIFIEPTTARKAQEELTLLQISEDNEIRKVLYLLTGLVDDYAKIINMNIDIMETLDFLFAKAKLSISMRGKPAELTEKRHIIINNGRHPLLDQTKAIPLKFAIGTGIDAIVITGPNTGGKTVALKTVGLLSLMAQSGLHVPVDEDSLFSIHSNILCDIGDGQSIEQNLSTFSSHLSNIIGILDEADNRSLILLDELGSGTDPTEGMGLAIALLEAFKEKGCLMVATTHYPEIKGFAANTPGFCNARMAFDLKSLLPLYQLELGIAGESCALHIADRLGLPKDIIKRANEAAYGTIRKVSSGTLTNNTISKETQKKLFTIVNEAEADTKAESKALCNYKIGDSVRVRSSGKIGIVYSPVNSMGDVGIQVQGKKFLINYKRIKLHTPAEELYPDYPNYDLSLIFDSVETRKTRKKMGKGHYKDKMIILDDERYEPLKNKED